MFMSNQRYSEEFQEEAVHQIIDRRYSAKEVSERPGVSTQSLYKWVKAVKPSPQKVQEKESLEAKREEATD